MSSKDYILAIDLGTSGVKTMLFDSNFAHIEKAFSPCETSYPQSGWAEQNPNDWWKALKETINSVLTSSGVRPEQIAVIGIDAMTPVMVAIDKDGEALRPAIIWMDRRAQEACRQIERDLGDVLYRINGNHNDPSNFAPKAMWFKANEPELYNRTAMLHHANGFFVYRLTGVHSLDKTQCGLSQLCDTTTAEYSESVIKACGLDRKKLPDIYESTDIVGQVTAAAARELGLAEGIPVIAGSMDNVAAGLGLGVRRNGELYLSAGTATNVCLCLDRPVFNRSFHIYSHIVPNTWLTVAGVDFGGAGFKWFKELLGDMSYAELDKIVQDCWDDLSRPLLFLPYMVGQRAPIWNDHTRGVLFGLSPSMGRGVLARTFMEGNAMGVNRVIDIFQNLGHKISSAKLTGGAAESAVYSQIFADVTGCDMEIVHEKDVATLGIGMAAAYGVKMYSSFDDMIKLMDGQRVIKPCETKIVYYQELQELFSELFETLVPAFEKMSKIKRKYTRKKG